MNLEFDKFCLFADVDGTLIDIASRPENARATSEILIILDRLYIALGGALAIVSGRRIEDIDRLFAPLRLPASGVHGAELRTATNGAIVDGGGARIPEAVAQAVQAIAARHVGVFVEDKEKALAVHWRAAQERQDALRAELDAAIEAAPDLAILRGHCVFEIKSRSITKGDAVRAFMEVPAFAGRVPVFIGDDVTDIAAIAAVKALGGLAYSVGQRLAGADAVFGSPADVRGWLAELAGMKREARSA